MNKILPRKLKTLNIREKVNLKAYNSFQVESGARYFAEVYNTEQLVCLIKQSGFIDRETLILGGGSNILFRNSFNGLVIKMSIPGIELVREDDDFIWVKAGAGVNWHEFVLFCLKHDYAGVENLSLIPGNVGAAPIQNIGAYGTELEQVFHQLEGIDQKSGEVSRFDREDCSFAYRDSIFKNELKNRFVITAVTVRLKKRAELNLGYGAIPETLDKMKIDNPTIRDVSDAVCRIRRSKLPDPAKLGNSGSFFKNPVVEASFFRSLKQQYPEMPHYVLSDNKIKIPAAWLIEQCGWKGKTIGNTGTHKKHALVIVNYGGATGSEIYDFSMQVRESVAKEFDIQLIPEVNIV